MRINVYSQELTDEVLPVSKISNTGIEYKAVQFVLHSSPMLHHPPADDDRSAVTFWLPQSERGLGELMAAFSKARQIVARELNIDSTEVSDDWCDEYVKMRSRCRETEATMEKITTRIDRGGMMEDIFIDVKKLINQAPVRLPLCSPAAPAAGKEGE